MKKISFKNFLIAVTVMLSLWSCQKGFEKSPVTTEEIATQLNSPKDLKDFEQVNLVGDNNDFNPARVDGSLINGWGVTFGASGPAWVEGMALQPFHQ